MRPEKLLCSQEQLLTLELAILMDEMCQDRGMTGYLKNAGRRIRSIEAFQISLARKRLVQVAIENRSIDVSVRCL